LNNKTYGIGAKRTLRERYKQFIKTAQMSQIDVMIEITLGIDLTEEKVRAIRNHNVFLFVSDEVYQANQYLKDIEGVLLFKRFNTKNIDKVYQRHANYLPIFRQQDGSAPRLSQRPRISQPILANAATD